MQVRRRWHASDHHTLIKRRSWRTTGLPHLNVRHEPQPKTPIPTSKRIEFLLKCSRVHLYGCLSVSASQCVCVRVCVLSVNCPCICYFYAWFIDFILWPLDWTLNEFLNSLRSGAGLINFWFPHFAHSPPPLASISFVRVGSRLVFVFSVEVEVTYVLHLTHVSILMSDKTFRYGLKKVLAFSSWLKTTYLKREIKWKEKC